MLCLKNESNSGWIEAALNNLDSVIIDHAHCEKKAAQTGMNLINAYPDKTELTLAMADLVEEEIDHFRQVVKILERRNVKLTKDTGDDYAKELFKQLRKQKPVRLMDHLLVAGIIEARSCERLKILADNIKDSGLKDFYEDLFKSEAGHYVTFVKLAKLYFPEKDVDIRLDELTNIEAEIISSLSNKPLMHG
ncbi:MAG: tRNA-(ms[2]io[6]A)-hydroxylase [Ignavibacteria bacterium]|nr:MAG: tRNA-(ms[2]io[6]A)-hydroxylase [Ignavibacteria bacterium]